MMVRIQKKNDILWVCACVRARESVSGYTCLQA